MHRVHIAIVHLLLVLRMPWYTYIFLTGPGKRNRNKWEQHLFLKHVPGTLRENPLLKKLVAGSRWIGGSRIFVRVSADKLQVHTRSIF